MHLIKSALVILGSAALLIILGLYLWDGLLAFIMSGHLWGPYARRLPITLILIIILMLVVRVIRSRMSRMGRQSRH